MKSVSPKLVQYYYISNWSPNSAPVLPEYERFMPSLLEQGYLPGEAAFELHKSFELAQILLELSGGELESWLYEEHKTNLHTDYGGPRHTTHKAFAGLLELAPGFNPSDFFRTYAKFPNLLVAGPSALRYLDFWVLGDGISGTLSDFTLTKEGTRLLSKYFHKIQEYFGDSSLFLSKVENAMLNNGTLLPVLSNNPLGSVSSRLRQRLESLVEGDIHISDSIIPVNHITHSVGHCQTLTNYHASSFLDPNIDSRDFGSAVLIRVDGVVVASMKMIGDLSMLALRNARTSDGRFPLVRGAAYATSLDITQQAVRAYKAQGSFATLDVEILPAFPIRMAHGAMYDKDFFVSKIERRVRELAL